MRNRHIYMRFEKRTKEIIPQSFYSQILSIEPRRDVELNIPLSAQKRTFIKFCLDVVFFFSFSSILYEYDEQFIILVYFLF
jgi:hypothetical protein